MNRRNRCRSSVRSCVNSGFTLVELLIVLVILSVLAALAYPGYGDYVTRTRRMEGQVALMNAMQQQEHHRALHHTYVAFSSAAPSAGLPWWSGNSAAGSAYELEAQACPGGDLRDCVLISARPGTANVDARFADPECGTLTLASTGEQGASGSAGNSAGNRAQRCWP
ncbi:type IV pilin protein [Massilia niabensis]|uniref:Type IV pilin protein n=1 Tax=Massilia niabensis TaxID=544910 RepID=A0ABW0L363_9BURK